MKWIVFLSLCWWLQEKSFVVVSSEGGAYLERKPADSLKRGDMVAMSDKYRFKTLPGYVHLAGPGGTMTITDIHDPRTDPKRSAEVWLLVKNELMPTRTFIELRGRAGVLLTVDDVAVCFGRFAKDSLPLLIMDTLKFEIGADLLPADGHQFFYLSWVYNGTTINTPLPVKTEKGKSYLLFDQALLMVKGQNVGAVRMEKAVLQLYDKTKKTSARLAMLDIRFTSFAKLKPELSLVASHVAPPGGHTTRQKLTYQYLLAYYGFMEETTFNTIYYPRL